MISFIFSRSFFQERKMVVLFLIMLLLLAANIAVVLVNLESRNYQVPTRYSDFSTSPLERDNWQTLYALPVFSVAATFFNAFLAIKVHESRRDIAIAVLAGGIFILFVNLFVSWSLLSLI